MRKDTQSNSQRGRRKRYDEPVYHDERPVPNKIDNRPIKGMNDNQKRYLAKMAGQTLTLGLGPAGTGKTFLASSYAAEQFEAGAVSKIIVSRPAIEAGEAIGFLPGEMEDKIGPYFVPVLEVLERRLGKSRVKYALEHGQIEFVPLAYMRGRTFSGAFVILDEAQNATPRQMKMFLTRIGEDAKVVINGDLNQSDIPGPNGLADAIEKLSGIPGIAQVTFTRADVVRSGIARAIVDAYEGEDSPPLPKFITNAT
ncbi:PhoH family protein [Asticcacaulis sp. AND118]|uniref:PhoH family protein n=1 Tax=Asticcacaulis sp. AND118 TaxID=2840468 RepID=UPI001CFFAFB8|nr:PhoH family protein [Asticcacaulis sp. AND118]UDF05082.1 PhoH family protein [Asticcacaulis sp. AND118]